jgi:hypothetical protein
MTQKQKMISLVKITSSLLVLVVSVSGCSTLKKATSDAYNIGYQTGEEFATLGDFGELVNSYIPDDTESQFDTFAEEDVLEYCDGVWEISGLFAGIVNSKENKKDFVSGCSDGFNSKW